MHEAPLLTIVCNNARWARGGRVRPLPSTPKATPPADRSPTPLSDLRPVPDFGKIRRGVRRPMGERVTDPQGRCPTPSDARLKIVREERRQVLLNIISE